MDIQAREKRVIQIFQDAGAFLQGHFVLASNKHCGSFINSADINSRANALSALGKMIADDYRDEGVEVVAGMATGSIGLSNWVAYWLDQQNPPVTIFAETPFRFEDVYTPIIRRGFINHLAGKRVLIVDDVLAGGETMRTMTNLLRNITIPKLLPDGTFAMDSNYCIIQEVKPAIPVGGGTVLNIGGHQASDLGLPKFFSALHPEDQPEGFDHRRGHFEIRGQYFYEMFRANKLSDIGQQIADQYMDDNVEVVAGLATGCIAIANWVAYWLNPARPPLTVYAEQVPSKYMERPAVLRRGFKKLIQGKRVLIVDDIILTGKSAQKVVDLVKETKIPPKGSDEEVLNPGIPVGVAVLCNRGGSTADYLGVPRLVSLSTIPIELYAPGPRPGNCPLCDKHQTINTEYGKGAEFVTHYGDATTWFDYPY
jgi:orotate phosphoribosyltransferase